MDSTSASNLPKLQLYRCPRCRRAFFSEERQNLHFLTSHSQKTDKSSNHTNLSTSSKNKVLVKPKLRKMYHDRYGKCSREAVFQTLLQFWPPERAFNKICMKHRIGKRKTEIVLKRMVSDKYCPFIHGTQDIQGILLNEYAKQSTLTQQRVEDIGKRTGLAHSFIRLGFFWKRQKGHQSVGSQLLHETFFQQPYPDDETLQMLLSKTGLSLSLVVLWFRLMRAKYKILEFREIEEKLLWAWFLKSPESVADDKDVKEVCSLVGMKSRDVRTLFEFWRTHWCSANAMGKEVLASEGKETSMETVLKLLERARSSQKIFGIPTTGKITEYLSSRSCHTTFGSYIPRKKSKFFTKTTEPSFDEKMVSKLETRDRSHSSMDVIGKEMKNQPHRINSPNFCERNEELCSFLRVQRDVLEVDHRSQRFCRDEKVERNLYSLFNTSVSGRTSEKGALGPEKFALQSAVPSNVIDLTLDSDSSEDDGELTSIATEEKKNISRPASFSAGVCGDGTDELWESDEPLVICESDDENTSQSMTFETDVTTHLLKHFTVRNPQ